MSLIHIPVNWINKQHSLTMQTVGIW